MDALSLMLAAVAGILIGTCLGAWLTGRGSAERMRQLREDFATLRDAVAQEREGRAAAVTDAALARQEADNARAAMQDWEKTRAEFLQSTQASVLTTAQQISSKLLEDHKRETAEAKAAAEQQVKQTTEQLHADLKQMSDGVSQLKGQVAERSERLDTVWRALSSPGGAGYFAEVGLANTLKSLGLAEGRDFVLQLSIQDEQSRKRPDAIVFLPGDALLVIDSKASKHLLDLAQAEGSDDEEIAYRNLARTMNQHLKDLTDRDYRSAVHAAYRRAGREGSITRLMTVMYLPNEAALEKLSRADPQFIQRASKAEITPVGPAGLASIVGFASVQITLHRQIENRDKIVSSAERLLEALAVAVGHATSVGKGIRTAADAFGKLSGSLNSRVLPRAREMHHLGAKPNKPIPPNLPAYQVLDLGAETIEGEAIDVEEPSLPPPG
jgi:DNA recombination protein RmuC